MRLPQIAVRRPVTMLMGVGIIFLLGIISLTQLPIDLLPSIEAPVIAIQTSYPDAGPYEVENFVTRPIEEALGAVSDVKTVSSMSGRGTSTVVAEFDWGVDMDFVALDVREKVDLIRPLLPEEADSPIVVKFDPTDMPVMQIVIVGDLPLFELREIASNQVRNKLERISGVASVGISGGVEREIQVNLHPGSMRSHGVSIEGVAQALSLANLNLPGGTIIDHSLTYIVRTTGQFTSIDQIRQVRVPARGGQTVAISDVAEVVDGFKQVTRYSRLNDQPAVSLSVHKEASANSVQVAELVREEINHINQELASRVQLWVAEDVTVFIQQSVEAVRDNAIIGAILAMTVLLLFLGNLRPTLIIGLAIPISVLATFVLMFFSDTTLNMISLGGLALGVGMLVDNAIVVLENIFYHRQQDKSGAQAAYEGATEVGTAIGASTLTTVSVFLPVVFISGIAAEIFRDMALTVTFALLTSLLISLTIVPMLSSHLLKKSSAPTGLLRPFVGLINSLQALYGRIIPEIIRLRWLVAAVVLLLVGLAYFSVERIGAEFMPQLDQGEIRVNLELPRGTPLQATNEVVSQVEQYVAGIPGVHSVFAAVGSSSGSEYGRVGLVLQSLGERTHSTEEIAEKLREYVELLPGVESRVSLVTAFGGFFGSPIQVEVRGNDLAEMEIWADLLVAEFNKSASITDLTHSLAEGEPELQVVVNRDKAASYGVAVGQIASAVRTAVSGNTVTRYRTGGEEIDITLRFAKTHRENVSDIESIPINTPRGVVPLRELADLERASSPITIHRDERARMVAITGYISGSDLNSVIGELRQKVAALELPSHLTVEFGGQDSLMYEAFDQLTLAMLLGVVLVYMVLASLFESLLQPLIIMVTLPLAGIGVVLGLLLSGVTFSVVSFVGTIMLAGIVVNNGIVLIDYINLLRSQGVKCHQAVQQAGERRLRPILMTSLTTILGMIPLALGVGEGRELQQPIAVVVIGGLLSSTFLTLFMIPVFYTMLDDFRNWISRLMGRPGKDVGLSDKS